MLKYLKQQDGICQQIVSTLQKFDLFGLPPHFRILKKQKFNTYFGLLCSALSIIVCLIYAQAQISQLISYTNPSVVMSEIQPQNGIPFPLLKSNFTFVLTITDPTLNPYTALDKYYHLKMTQSIRTRNIDESGQVVIKWNYTQIPLEACNPQKHFTNAYQEQYFAKFRLANLYCINSDFWEQNPPILQGHTQADRFALLTITFTKCQNSTNYTGCASDEEIATKLKSGYYAIYMSDSLPQMSLPNKPYEDIITLQYTPFTITQSSLVSSIMKVSQTQTDYGLFQKDLTLDQSLLQDNIQTTTSPYNSQYIVQNNIFFQQRQSYYSRSYVKIQTILASVGGLWQLITSVIAFLLYPILFTSLNLTMANKLFSFANEKSYDLQINSVANSVGIQQLGGKSDGILEYSTLKIPGKIKARPSEIEQAKTYIELKKFLKSKNTQLVFGIIGALKYTFGCGNKNKRQVSYAMNKILKKLDVCYLLQKISELDKLKDILLTKDQLALFNYIPKPLIPCDMFNSNFEEKVKELEERKEYEYILREEKSSFLKINDAYNAYIRLKKKDEQDKIDKLIISYLDADIKKLFEKIYKLQDDNQFLLDNIQVSEIFSPQSNNQLNSEPHAQEIQQFLYRMK